MGFAGAEAADMFMKALVASLCLVILLPGCVTEEAPAPAAEGLLPAEISAQPIDGSPLSQAPGEALPAEGLACLGSGNLWVRAGQTDLFACVRPTTDAGKVCRKGTDCEGECLARSMSCAPYDPLLGCNDILQDNGARVTLCLN